MTKFYSTALFKNIYKKPSTKSEITSQILFGEKFKIILKKKNWIKIKSISDNYKGFIKNNKLLEKLNPTHKCFSLKTRIYKYKKTNKICWYKIIFAF
ncbi:MAG: SH3 domain-containing protein [Candidatus Pelagibacter sp.]